MKTQTKILLVIGLAAAISSCHPAWADSWAVPNKGGGEIVITDRKCPDHPKLLEAYTHLSTGKYLGGCWAVIDDAVHVVWKDGDRSVYPLEAFRPKSVTNNKGVSL